MKMIRYGFILLLLLSACSALPNHKDDLGKMNYDFILQVRWLEFAGAAKFFAEDYQAEFLERFDDVDDLKITEFSMVRMEVEVPEEKVIVHYRLDYYLLPSASVKKKRFSLTWEQPPGAGGGKALWRISDKFPELP